MRAAFRLFSWTMELLAFASRQFARQTMDFAVRFIHSHFVQFFLVSDCKRTAEAACGAKRLVYYALTRRTHPRIIMAYIRYIYRT